MSKKEPTLIASILSLYGFDGIPNRKGWQSIRCNFHDDQTASASVNLDLGAYKCHGCGEKGDAVSLVKKQEGLPDRASAECWIEKETGISREDIRKQCGSSSKLSKSKRNRKRGRPPLPPGSRKGPDKGS